MIERATRRNQAHVDAGRAAFHAVALDGAGFLDDRFDKVFAINVRLFRQEDAREADVLRQLLEPHGAVFLFQQHPSEARTRAVTDELATALERNGFAVHETVNEGGGDSLMTSIVAVPDGNRGRRR
jgi:hypothetical protein